MSAIQATETATTRSKRELTPTELEIQKLQEDFAKKKAQLRATGIRADLVKAVKAGNMSDEQLYPFAKAFCNNYERIHTRGRKAKTEETPAEK